MYEQNENGVLPKYNTVINSSHSSCQSKYCTLSQENGLSEHLFGS